MIRTGRNVRASALILVHIRRRYRSFQFALEIFASQTYRYRLSDNRLAQPFPPKKTSQLAYFFASNHLLPNNPGRSGTTLSSARNMPFSLSSILRASKGLNLPLSFVIPITREINLIPCDSSSSLYSRWGSFVIRHTAFVRGSMSGCSIGLGAVPNFRQGM